MQMITRRPQVVLLIPIVFLAIGAIATAFDSDRGFRQSLERSAGTDAVNAEIEANKFEAEANRAETRYSSGSCTLSDVPLKPGMTTSELLPDSAICDRHGNTAIVSKDGQLEEFAKTNNTEVIREFLGW